MSRQAILNAWHAVSRFVQRVNAIISWDPVSTNGTVFLQLNDVAVLLFSTEFKLHLPGGPYSFPAPEATAFLVGSAEILFPILLVLGLATRLAACGLLIMTLVVELTVLDGWPVHVTWAAMALGIMASGPGRLSLDHWFGFEQRKG
jgi:putative oxidoreductase